jgi:CRP-like cAMP-binding protein
MLEGCRLFRFMPYPELRQLAADAAFFTRRRGEQVLPHLGDGRDIFVLFEGVLLANRFSISGREVAFRRILPGDCFGQIGAIDGLPRSAGAVALTDARIGRIGAAGVERLLESSVPFVRALAEDLAAMVRESRERLFEAHAYTVPRRVDLELLRMAACAGIEGNRAVIRNSPTHAELASLVGGQREAVTRQYQRLMRGGVIRRFGRTLHVLDVQALAGSVAGGGSVPR